MQAKEITSAAMLILLIIVPASSLYAATALTQPDAFVSIFDGSSFKGWNQTGDANWNIVDQVIQADSGRGMLVTQVSYQDFYLKLEFWVDLTANSGVFIRCTDPAQVTPGNSYEVNIFDTRPDQTYRTGGIVNIAAPTSVINTGNQWNSYEIIARGSRLVAVLNGVVTVDVEDSRFASGPIALQYGSGIVKFRNVEIGLF